MKQWILIITTIKGDRIVHTVEGPFPTLNSAIKVREKKGGVVKTITFDASVKF